MLQRANPSGTEMAELHRRLCDFGRKGLQMEPWEAEDAASYAILEAMERGIWDIQYLFTILKGTFKNDKFKRHKVALKGSASDFPPGYTRASQEAKLEINDCISTMKAMSPRVGRALSLAAAEYEYHEIAKEMNITHGWAKKLVAEGRRILRTKDLYEIGPRKWVGIRRMGRKWVANIHTSRTEIKYLGMFATASEAARAYDVEARKMGKSNLNFPDAYIDSELLSTEGPTA